MRRAKSAVALGLLNVTLNTEENEGMSPLLPSLSHLPHSLPIVRFLLSPSVSYSYPPSLALAGKFDPTESLDLLRQDGGPVM